MAVPTIFLTRCHAGADEDADEEDEDADPTKPFFAQLVLQVLRCLLHVVGMTSI